MALPRVTVLACLALSACGPRGARELTPTGVAGRAVPPPRVSALTATLPAPVAGASAAVVGNSVFVAGGVRDAWPGDGSTANCSDLVNQLVPETGALSSYATLPVKNRGHGLFAVPPGELVSAMGYCGTSATEEEHVYQLQPGRPILLGMLPVGSFYFAGGILTDNGKAVLVTAGGYGSGPERDQIQRFDFDTNTGRALSVTLPTVRPLGAGAVSGNTLYVLGGSRTGTPPASAATNPLTDQIVAVTLAPESATVVARLPEPLFGGCAVTAGDGTIYLFGGARYVPVGAGLELAPSDGIVVFTPSTGEVAYADVRLPQPLAGLACARLPNERVFLFGGAGAGGAPTSAILSFEPSTYLVSLEPPVGVREASLELDVGVGCGATGGAPWLGLFALLGLRRRRR